MSRYNNIDTVSFEDINSNEFPVKDIRPLSDFETGIVAANEEDLFIDELISRKDFYSDGTEDQTYAVLDHNAEKIVENDFDLTKLKTLKIPIVDET